MPPTAPRVNDPPCRPGQLAEGRHHLFIVAFSRFLYTHVDGPREGGGEEARAATGLCPLAPAKEMGLPALPPSPLTHSSSSAASHVWGQDGGAVLPPRFPPRQLGSVFAMSISFPNGKGPHSLLTGLLWDWAPCLPWRAQSGPSLQPLC